MTLVRDNLKYQLHNIWRIISDANDTIFYMKFKIQRDKT